VAALAGGVWFLVAQTTLSWPMQVLAVGEIMLALWTGGVLLQMTRWSFSVEFLRLASLFAVAVTLLPGPWRMALAAFWAVDFAFFFYVFVAATGAASLSKSDRAAL
jgi:hypothetical protein